MPTELVLAADDSVRDALLEAGELSPCPTEGVRPATMEYVNPEVLVDPASSATPLARRALDEQLAQLQGACLCRLAVVGETSGENPIRSLIEWYERLHHRLERLGYRKGVVKEALVLVFTCEIQDGWREDLRRLFATDDACGPRGPIYLMTHRLNWEASAVFFAIDVWPIAVGRLCLWLGTQIDHLTQSKELRAWRAVEVVFGTQESFDEVFASGLSQARKRLIADEEADRATRSTHRGAPNDARPRGASLPERAVHDPNAGSWPQYRVPLRLRSIVEPESWSDDITGVTGDYRLALSEHLLGADRMPIKARGAWETVHASIRSIENTSRAQSLVESPDVAKSLKAAMDQWERVVEGDARLQVLRQDARECGDELELAQGAFLHLAPRIVFAMASAGLVGFVAFIVLTDVIGQMALTLWAVVAAFVGGAIGAFLPAWVESRKGARAIAAFENDCLGPVEKLTRGMHEQRLKLRDSGLALHGDIEASAMARSVGALVSRLSTVVNRELKDDGIQAVRGEEGRVDRKVSGKLPARQEAYRSATRRLLLAEDEPTIQKALRGKLPGFSEAMLKKLETSWQDFCRDCDKQFSGDLPLLAVVGLIRAFRRMFCVELARLLCDVSIEQVGGASAMADRMTKVKEDEDANRFVYGFSSPVINRDMTTTPHSTLMVRSDLGSAILDELSGVVVSAGGLAGRPVAALLMTEARLAPESVTDVAS